MIKIIQKSMGFFLEKIRNGEAFSFTRYWDGELSCMLGREGFNCDGCHYTQELREGLCRTITNNYDYYHALNFPSTHTGTTNLRKAFIEYLEKAGSKIQWYDATIWQRCYENHAFHEIVNSLKSKEVIFVAGKHLKKVVDRIEGTQFIEIPMVDAFESQEEIKKVILDAIGICKKNPIFIFCAGMASNTMIDDLFPAIGDRVTMIDMGSVWDAFIGLETRQWIRRAKRNG